MLAINPSFMLCEGRFLKDEYKYIIDYLFRNHSSSGTWTSVFASTKDIQEVPPRNKITNTKNKNHAANRKNSKVYKSRRKRTYI